MGLSSDVHKDNTVNNLMVLKQKIFNILRKVIIAIYTYIIPEIWKLLWYKKIIHHQISKYFK